MIKAHRVILYGLFCAFAAGAQTVTNVVDTFDTNTYPNGTLTNKWSNWFGGAFQSLSLDSSSDANNNSNSGALKIVANFPTNTDQFTVWNGYSGINPALSGIQFTNLQCDVRFAAGSATNSSGNFGSLQFGMGTPSWGQDYFAGGSVVISAGNTNWVHVSLPLDVNADANLNNIANIFVHIWGAGLVGSSTLWVDNLQFVGMATNTGTAMINYTNTQQRIDGFGASSAWMSGSLAAADADLLFSTNNGVGLSLLRTRIAPGGTTWEGGIAQQALARGARIWSTPWTPPSNFKVTNSWIGTNSSNGGNFSSSVANYQGYASELAGYVAYMKNTYGISLYAVSVQNEPDMSVNYESCRWSSQQIHDFLPYLAAAMTASNVASTKIMLPEKSGWSWDLATNTMNDTATSNRVDILAGHNYGSSATAVTQFGTPCPKTLWETEHYFGTDDGITNGLALAQEIHAFMTVAQANAYHYWWLTGSGTGSIADNTAHPAKRLFVMGNYSRFVRPDFYRVGLTNSSPALISAYKDSGSSNFVIVAANPAAYPVNQTFVLTNFPVIGTLTQWVTSASLSLSNQGPVSVTNRTFNRLLPAWTIVSYVFTQPAAPGIVQPPTNQSGVVGGSAAFSVVAGGAAPLFYQWLFNGTNHLLNATNASLTLTGIALTNAGNYSVIVTNYAGSITSTAAALTVVPGPFITLATSDASGSTSWNAAGQWSSGAAPVAGNTYCTSNHLLRTPPAAGNQTFAGDFLVVTNGGTVTYEGTSTAAPGDRISANWVMGGGSIGNGVGGDWPMIAGTMNVIAPSGINPSAAGRVLIISATLSGSALLTNGVSAAATVYYTNDNATAFTGPLRVDSGTSILAGSQTNLGGNPAAFNAAQLILDNGIFQPVRSFALANANSGVTLDSGGGTFNIGSGLTLAVSNPIAGAGTLVCIGGGTLVLAASNTATGNLLVSNSTLALAGNASFKNGLLGISNNAALDVTALNVPLAIGNRIALAGNLIANVNRTGTVSRLTASNIVFGGTLILSNSGPAFAAGDAFTVFAAGNYSGAFAGIAPVTPGTGLVWDTSKLAVNGTIQAGLPPTVSIAPVSTNVIYGNNVVLTAKVTGTEPLSYQWYDRLTNAIPGAAAASFTNNPEVADSGNYSVIVANPVGQATNFSALTVAKAPLTVTANNTNRMYGAANPGFTASYDGFVNHDNFSSAVTGSPALSTGATSSSGAGIYTIVAADGTLDAANYRFIFVAGTLAVTLASCPTNLTTSVSGANLTLAWPLTHLGWTLQAQTNACATGLGPHWVDVANSSTTNQITAPINPANGSVFYRLRQ